METEACAASRAAGGLGAPSALGHVLEMVARGTTTWTGSSSAFAAAVGVVIVWAVLGPVFHFSDTWQLVINTGTTIVTFLMVFLIQRTQNKDSLALHLKLNEIVACLEGASNRLVNVEDLTEAEVRELHDRYQEVSARAQHETGHHAHSIEEVATHATGVATEAPNGGGAGMPEQGEWGIPEPRQGDETRCPTSPCCER